MMPADETTKIAKTTHFNFSWDNCIQYW